MTWLGIVKTLLIVIVAFVEWLKRKEAIDAASAEIVAGNARASLDAISRARAARDAVRDDALSVSDDPDNRDSNTEPPVR